MGNTNIVTTKYDAGYDEIDCSTQQCQFLQMKSV